MSYYPHDEARQMEGNLCRLAEEFDLSYMGAAVGDFAAMDFQIRLLQLRRDFVIACRAWKEARELRALPQDAGGGEDDSTARQGAG